VLMLHGILGTPDHFRELLPLVPETWSVHALLLDEKKTDCLSEVAVRQQVRIPMTILAVIRIQEKVLIAIQNLPLLNIRTIFHGCP
ncbi:MAG: hypothetical protein IIX11_01590, partial [Selenomonadales bacterium]|nr:hypothetical protein [Selenomonadales bacterium]